jgi:hypothetical protein
VYAPPQSEGEGEPKMPYDQYRLDLIRAFYRWQLDQFLHQFDIKKSTVILLPGGMGSDLARTEHAYPSSGPNPIDDTVWADWSLIFNSAALKLEMDDKRRDKDQYVLGANGPLSFFASAAYDEFIAFAKNKGWNILTFGFDWRRSLTESAGLFKFLMGEFRKQVTDTFGKDPISNVTIVCHSMGGTVATLALRDPMFASLPFHAVVTVATPFYGTSTHQQRYYIGQDLLNPLYTVEIVTRIVGSLPGPYSLMFLPKAVFDTDGQAIGLAKYPLRDSQSDKLTDPFDRAFASRWPKYAKLGYLKENRDAMIEIAKPLDQAIAAKFFNVRSKLDKSTAVELLWENIDGASFDPGSGYNPLKPVKGPGDGTVPFWSAWHAHSKADNRFDLAQASDHEKLFLHPETMAVIGSVVSRGRLPTRPPQVRVRPPSVASAGTAKRVLADAVDARARGAPLPDALSKPSVRRAIITGLMS